MRSKVSVIIPAYNEEKTIGKVINIVKKSSIKNEIIVVDNCSTDRTSSIARDMGVKVVYCADKGKGVAMLYGLKEANSDIIVYLDADIADYEEDIIDKLVEPIINRDVDFVKSTFNRKEGGVVTEVMVKPLLNILFPNIYKFSEPISGMIACKKIVLENIEFENDYGVDIGILLDVIYSNAKIEEVNIGNITNGSHKNKLLKHSSKMSSEIMRVILKKYNKLM